MRSPVCFGGQKRHYLMLEPLLCSLLNSSRGPSTSIYPRPISSCPNILAQTVQITLHALSHSILTTALGTKCFHSPHLTHEQTGSVVKYISHGHRAVTETELLLKPRSDPKLLVLNLDNHSGQIRKWGEYFQGMIFNDY